METKMTRKTYRDERDQGMSQVATAIEHIWGPRCPMHEASCSVCHQWAVFDYMMRSLDSSCLDDTVPLDD